MVRMLTRGARRMALALVCLPAVVLAATGLLDTSVSVTRDYTELVLETEAPIRFSLYALRSPHRFVLDLEGVEADETLERLARSLGADNPHIERLRVERIGRRGARLRLDLRREAEPHVFALAPREGHRHRLVLEVRIPQTVDETALEATWLAVVLNGREQPAPALVLRRGSAAPLVRGQELQQWRLRLPPVAATMHENESFYPLGSISGLMYRIDEPSQVLFLDVPAGLFLPTEITAAARDAPVPGEPGTGAFLNYDLSLQREPEVRSAHLLLEAGGFGRWGSVDTRLLAGDGGTHGRTIRLDSGFTRDDLAGLSTLRIGDGITGSSAWWGGAARFGGVQWASNFAMRPGLITFPLPELAGEAHLPSTLDLYVNESLQLRRELPAGPFTVHDVPVVTGRGEMRVVVRDLLGREQVIAEAYFASARLLRPGLSEYSYEVGAVRENFGIASNDYGRPLAVGTHRRGLTDHLTGEVHGELLSGQQTLGIAGAFLCPAVGVVSAALAGSRSPAGTGQLVAVGLEQRLRRVGFGVSTQLAAGQFVHAGLAPDRSAPRRVDQAFANLGTRYGSFGAGFTRRDPGGLPATGLLNAGFSANLRGLGFLSLTAVRALGDHGETLLGLSFTRPLDARTSTSMHSSVRGEDRQATVELQRNLPAGNGFGYRVRAGAGDAGRHEAGLAWQHDVGNVQVEAAQGSGGLRSRADVSGAVVTLGGEVFPSRRIADSFAVVQVPGFPNVRVYRDNLLVGRTRSDGSLLLPGLRPYQRNDIRIEQADLPLDAAFTTAQLDAVPHHRNGLLLRFDVEAARAALLSVVLESGEPLPAGALVTMPGRSDPFPVGLRGEVYLTGLTEVTRLRVAWRGRTCELEVVRPPNTDPVPHLGRHLCKGVKP